MGMEWKGCQLSLTPPLPSTIVDIMEVERMKTLVGSMDGMGPAEALHAVAELQKEVSRTESSLVRSARQAGLSWEAIALCLGVSKQAVHQKYGKR